jgi:hypothetical protein
VLSVSCDCFLSFRLCHAEQWGAFLFLPAPQEQKGLFTAFGGQGLFLFLFIVQGSEHLTQLGKNSP